MVHALAPPSARDWSPCVSLDVDGAIAAVHRAIEHKPEQGGGEQAKRMGLCASGLVKPEALSILAAVDAPELLSAPPFDGKGAYEQPAWTLHAKKVVNERRRLAAERQNRELRASMAAGGK